MSRPTVLVVDDEPQICKAIERLLTTEGLTVVAAHDGDEALALLSGQPVDLVLSDLKMPGIDGITLLGKVRELHPDLPLILMTGFGVPQLAGELAELPVLGKPWDTTELRSVVLRGLGRAVDVAGPSAKKPVPAAPGATDTVDEEHETLMRIAGLTEREIQRAERIRQRMQHPRPLGEVLIDLGALSREAWERVEQARRAELSLIEVLREDGALADEDVATYEEARRMSPGIDDRELLLDSELVSEESFLRALCVTQGIEYTEPQIGSVDLSLLEQASHRYLLRQHVLPVAERDGTLRVTLADPLDQNLILELERIFGSKIEVTCCTREKIADALHTLQRLAGEGSGDCAGLDLQYREIDDLAPGDETGEEAVQIVDYLLARAIQAGASDLHIEPLQTKIRVRVRVDGVLRQLTELPIDFAPRIVSRIKVLAGADIAEKRLHQDGKIFVKLSDSEIDIRVSSYVSVFGETLVMRLLDRNRGLVPVEQIGFTDRAHALLTEVVLPSSSGLVLVVGPTGSGKTTTLYSFIQHANDPTEKVITCEDPVEYVLDGVVQCNVNSKAGPTFTDSLRAIVRQDPDTIVVGEIRDRQTVALALESALTGHKVFSTFHTEDSVGAFVRLLEMGAEPFLVASTVSAIVAQRLVRRLCPSCSRPTEPSRSQLRFLGIDRGEARRAVFKVAVGCPRCGGSGYKGRQALHEVLLPDDDFRDAVLRSAPAKELRQQARGLSVFLTLQEDGVLKAVQGRTTLEEVIGNAPRDTSPRPLRVLLDHIKKTAIG